MKYSVALTEKSNTQLVNHLIRKDEQEDLCFVLYAPSQGNERFSALINEILLPNLGERNLHGNVSFNASYFDRVISVAISNGMGIGFIHSHPEGIGWQGMSNDDIAAEKMLAPRVKAATGLPLLGMTVSSDSVWSARFWKKTAPRTYSRRWCETVRVTGTSLVIHYNERLLSPPLIGEEFVRTVSAWGMDKQNNISRLRIGIVGLGSVGSQLTEALAKTGIKNFILIDFDEIERKNLDRLLAARQSDIGRKKVQFYKEHLSKVSPSPKVKVTALEKSIDDHDAFVHALDCDIIFACADRPLPRFVLNQLAYANLIPIIDGGVDASINKRGDNIDQARWRSMAAGPGRRCLECSGQYSPEDVSLEMTGLLDDQHYIKGLPEDHFSKRGENVYIFSQGAANMMLQQFLSLIFRPKGVYYGMKEMDFVTGNTDADFDFACNSNCITSSISAMGDKINGNLFDLKTQSKQAV